MGNSRIQITLFSSWKINSNSTLNYFREVIWLELHSIPSFLVPYSVNLFCFARQKISYISSCVYLQGGHLTKPWLSYIRFWVNVAPYSTQKLWSPLKCCSLRTLENVQRKKIKISSVWNRLTCSTSSCQSRGWPVRLLGVLLMLVSLFWGSPSCSAATYTSVQNCSVWLARWTRLVPGSNLQPRVLSSHKLERFRETSLVLSDTFLKTWM